MGEDGRIVHPERQGLLGLYNRSVVNDTRYLTSYVRDISLVGGDAYRALQPPSSLVQFPADLMDPDVEYSGIYEDGWVAEESYIYLAGGGPGQARGPRRRAGGYVAAGAAHQRRRTASALQVQSVRAAWT